LRGDDPVYRLIFLFYEETPTSAQIEHAISALPVARNVFFARLDDHSRRASMWTRNPTGKLPIGRLALEYPTDDMPWEICERLAVQLCAEAHWCLGTSPIPIVLASGKCFTGTLQLCCFQRAQGLSDEVLENIWFDEHAQIAIDTQNTEGYRQNRVLCSSHDPLDGIVEEVFPLEAANSLTAFFADGHDEEKMMRHIHLLTQSSERVLDLAQSSVIHLTDKRLR
jgi:hypothetical protein